MTDPEIDHLLRTTLVDLLAKRRTPASTYRLQFHKGFTFRDAARIVPYLHRLGITHCYASPYLKARPGSTHGYDVVDHTQLNPELGTRDDYNAWMKAMRAAGMSHIVDIVPNHMGIDSDENKRWNDLLKRGPNCAESTFFDVAWADSPRPELKDRVLLPTLGEPYGDVLEKGQFKVEPAADSDGFVVAYFGRHFPLAPDTYDAIDSTHLATLNGTPGDPNSFEALHQLLSRQHYRLAYWRTASDEINYRRFFDTTSLAALAMEREDVFEAAHSLIFELISQGHIAGLRIDHSDGLYDPKRYFARLQRAYVVAVALKHLVAPAFLPVSGEAGKSMPVQSQAGMPGLLNDDALRARLNARASAILPDDATDQPLYVVTEKILAPGEPLPESWAIAGTSGYEVLNEISGLFVDPAGEKTLDACYRNFVGPDVESDYHELAYRKKRELLASSFASELNLLAHQLDRLAQQDRHSRDFTLDVLRGALTGLIPCFGIYRIYVNAPDGVSDRDSAVISDAIHRACQRDLTTDARVYHFIRDLLLLRGPLLEKARDEALRFVGKFQQLTSPVTAKGLEDTAFYIYHRLTSLNEVGGEPSRFGVSVESLHKTFAARQREWPRAMSVLSTHDTKRSEDVRARIHVLSELADEWTREVGRWRSINHSEGVHPNDEYLLYQTLMGAWPNGDVDDEFAKRIDAYVQKAMREAKERTSWISLKEPVEKAMSSFIARILDASRGRRFQEAFLPFQRRVARIGMVNSLAQTLVRLTAPGVPDTYQGTELWDLSLVDPDNRRPVDYALREKLLASLPGKPDGAAAREMIAHWQDGRAKLLVTATALRLRRERAELFDQGDYAPLQATGSLAGSVFAFARRWGERSVVIIVPRLIAAATDADGRIDWQDTRIDLPAGTWRDAFTSLAPTDGSLALLLGEFPVALLVS